MLEQTNKEKILLVLKESVKFGREANFYYDDMFEKHKEVLYINNLSKTIKEKIELFANMAENSHLFQTIYDCAKLAHQNLVTKQRYNFYCADLILKFNSLEEVFKRRLRPVRLHVNENIESKNIYRKQNEGPTVQIDLEDLGSEEIIYELPKGRFLEQGVTGKEMVERKNKRIDLMDALKSTTFE